MTWKAHEVIFHLRSPLHIGQGQMGNLRRTRPYVTGKTLWGALTMRITRNTANGPATDSRAYQETGVKVDECLAFTYFYPAIQTEQDFIVQWPWKNESGFRYRFLSSFAGATWNHDGQSSEDGSLREVEYLSPRARDTGEPVFLKGYIFEKQGQNLAWRSALGRLQLGGDRGYGWGDVQCGDMGIREKTNDSLFGGAATFLTSGDRPAVRLAENACLLAHAEANGFYASGDLEPLVGREWKSNNPDRRYRDAGEHVEFSGVCFAPGGVVYQAMDFIVGNFGVWRLKNNGIC